MYSPLHLAAKYLKYYASASNGKGHGMHSPFVFHFITRVLNDNTHYPDYDKVETLRAQLEKDKTGLTVMDMGAGSAVASAGRRTIASIAKNAAKPKKYGQLLYRMIKYYCPTTILELGTSLGITSAYLSLASTVTEIITLEGASAVAAVARQNFEKLQLQNIKLLEGNFDDTLPQVLKQWQVVDFVFVDGNHREEPTLRYFRQLLSRTGNDSIIIFDDIHWSREMESAWEQIRKDPAVRCSIDLFFIGIVFFRQEFREKQHFSIRF